MLSWIFIVQAHWNNNPRVDMSPHSDILFWIRANQSLLFLLNTTCLAEKKATNTNCIVFSLEPTIYRTRVVRRLTITPSTRLRWRGCQHTRYIIMCKLLIPHSRIAHYPASTLRIHYVAVWLLFGQVPFLRENYVATTYFRYVIWKSLWQRIFQRFCYVRIWSWC